MRAIEGRTGEDLVRTVVTRRGGKYPFARRGVIGPQTGCLAGVPMRDRDEIDVRDGSKKIISMSVWRALGKVA